MSTLLGTENNYSLAIQLFHYMQSWQCRHFCTTSNENELEVVANKVNFNANLHLL